MKPVPPSRSDSGSTGEAWCRAAGAVPLVVLALLWDARQERTCAPGDGRRHAGSRVRRSPPRCWRARRSFRRSRPSKARLPSPARARSPSCSRSCVSRRLAPAARGAIRPAPRSIASHNRSSRRCVRPGGGRLGGCRAVVTATGSRPRAVSSIRLSPGGPGSSAPRFRSKASGCMSWRRRSFEVRPDSAEPWSRWS